MNSKLIDWPKYPVEATVSPPASKTEHAVGPSQTKSALPAGSNPAAASGMAPAWWCPMATYMLKVRL